MSTSMTGYHAQGRDTGYDMYLRGDAPTPPDPSGNGGFHPEIYNPEQYLPASRDEWQTRVRTLSDLLADRTLAPCNDFLYMQRQDGVMRACIEGVINKAAIDAGVPAEWLEAEHPDIDGLTYWDVEQPDRHGTHPFGRILAEPNNIALPEALLYHGICVVEGRSLFDVLDCDYEFIAACINTKHGAVLGCDRLDNVNRKLIGQGANPLLVMSDVLRHLEGKPHCGFWHNRVSEWAR